MDSFGKGILKDEVKHFRDVFKMYYDIEYIDFNIFIVEIDVFEE